MGYESDLFQRRAVAWNFAIADLLGRFGIAFEITQWIPRVLALVEEVALVVVLAALLDAVERRWCDGAPARGAWLVRAAAAAGAVLLFAWSYTHPSGDITGFVCRWDYLAFAIVAGAALRGVPFRARVVLLAALSVVIVVHYTGRVPTAIVLAGCLLGYLAERFEPTRRPGRRVLVQGALMAATAMTLWRYRATNGFGALMGWGIFQYAALRHVSFVVESARGVPSSLCGYLCFLLFYPSAFGAIEVYDEFWERNLAAPPPRDYPGAARTVATGVVLLWLGVHVPMDADRFTASVGFVETWTNALVYFLRGALVTMGVWHVIEGGARFLDVRLRPNFPAVLAATSPSQFWRSWRATMTNWLIRYVYIPLGGNRRHQVLNIFAVFVVSTLWHCAGPPFLHASTWGAYDLAPLVLWGAVNFVGVAGHALVRRRRRPEPTRRQPWLVVALKWAPTMVFASVTTCLLGFALAHMDRFATVARSLVGLEGW